MSARDRFGAIAAQLEALERAAPPAERERTRALIHELLEAHKGALQRVLELSGEDRLPQLAADPDIAALLMLHGLHPVPLRERITRAVDALAGRLGARHAQLTLVSLDDDGNLLLRLTHAGERGACAAEIEEALAVAAADAASVQVDEQIVVPVQLDRLGARR